MKVKVVFNFKLLPHWYAAITLYPFICFRAPYAPIRVLRHEMIHVEQIRRDGFFTFYIMYLWYYLVGLVKYMSHDQAYYRIPYEVEARKGEQKSFTKAEIEELASQVETDLTKY